MISRNGKEAFRRKIYSEIAYRSFYRDTDDAARSDKISRAAHRYAASSFLSAERYVAYILNKCVRARLCAYHSAEYRIVSAARVAVKLYRSVKAVAAQLGALALVHADQHAVNKSLEIRARQINSSIRRVGENVVCAPVYVVTAVRARYRHVGVGERSVVYREEFTDYQVILTVAESVFRYIVFKRRYDGYLVSAVLPAVEDLALSEHERLRRHRGYRHRMIAALYPHFRRARPYLIYAIDRIAYRTRYLAVDGGICIIIVTAAFLDRTERLGAEEAEYHILSKFRISAVGQSVNAGLERERDVSDALVPYVA